jgi:hypothetical protein
MADLVDFSDLIGKTIIKIKILDKGNPQGNDEIIFETENYLYRMFHFQDCCEDVFIKDICGEINELIGSPILLAEERCSDENKLNEYDESFTWTFYEIKNKNISVTISWYGTSNGYYSEHVDLARSEKIKNGNPI